MPVFNGIIVLGLAALIQASPFPMDSMPINAKLARRWEPPTVPSNWINKTGEMTGEQFIAEYGHSGEKALLNRVRTLPLF